DYMVGIVSDITDRKVSETSLQSSIERYRALLNNMFSGVAVYRPYRNGEDFIFTDINESGATLSHVNADEVIGKPVTEAFPAIRDFGLFEVFQEVYRTGVSKHHPVTLYEDGRLNRWYENYVYRLPHGEIVAIYSDMTEYQEALAQAKEREAMLRGLLNAFRDPLLLFDRDYRVNWCNQAVRLFGTEKPQALGSDMDTLLSGSMESVRLLVVGCFSTGEINAINMPMAGKEGGERLFNFRVFPILSESDGVVSHVILSATDVDEKSRMQEQAMGAARLATLGVLSASIAHEINNPNHTILFNGPILEDIWTQLEPILRTVHDQQGGFTLGALSFDEVMAQVPSLLSNISKSSRRIQRIVDQLKSLVRKETTAMDERIDMAKVVQDATTLLHNKIQKMTRNLRCDTSKTLPHLRGNRQQVEQVVINLLLNALQALPDKERSVSLTVHVEDDVMRLIVEDEGVGMDEETLERITEPLFTTRIDSGGTGLGLSVCQDIVKRHKGRLLFVSTPGVGTRATVEFPLAEERM
ncbi:MAG: PAS domain-containing protein, partial [Magnetococcales bacterium]|nr:PAS domain-containing protein [Magnetococcales bacterium]